MDLELNILTGYLFFNNIKFVFYDEYFILNNTFLKKYFKVNGLILMALKLFFLNVILV